MLAFYLEQSKTTGICNSVNKTSWAGTWLSSEGFFWTTELCSLTGLASLGREQDYAACLAGSST